VACFVVAGRREDAARLCAWYDETLPTNVPLLVQCADIAYSEAKAWVKHPERLFGFDGLFLTQGGIVTVVGDGNREEVDVIWRSLGIEPVWVSESPALVLPRIVCQLVNEAAFAELEGVADGETIDLAMKLGVSYPRGPLEWGKALGYDKVLAVLDHLYEQYHEERYRACVGLRKAISY
jgi:3-hydroxybutyryl-CoA dehydrogenase